MEEEKRDNHRGFKIFIIIIVIISLFFIREENHEKVMQIIQSISNKEKALNLVDSFTHDNNISDINIYDDTIIKWYNNTVSFLNIDGSKIVDKEFNFVSPLVYWGEDY